MVSSSRNSELQTYAKIIRIVSFDASSFIYAYNNCLSSRYQPFRKHPGSTTTALPSTHSYTSAQVPTKSSPPPQCSHTQKDKSTAQAQIAYLPLSTTKTPSRLFTVTLGRAKYRQHKTRQALHLAGQNQKKGVSVLPNTARPIPPIISLHPLSARRRCSLPTACTLRLRRIVSKGQQQSKQAQQEDDSWSIQCDT